MVDGQFDGVEMNTRDEETTNDKAYLRNPSYGVAQENSQEENKI